MSGNSHDIKFLLITAALLLTIVGAALASNLGMLPTGKDHFITVVGTSTDQAKNNIATFSVSATTSNSVKEDAVNAMNTKTNKIIEAVKAFGVPEGDIKTTGLNVYQESVYNPSTGRSTLGDWKANSTIEVTLRDLTDETKANQLADLLNSTELGADTVYGPGFRVDEKQLDEAQPMKDALADAHKKASILANASGRKLGKIVNIVEGVSLSPAVPMAARGMGGGGADLAPGTSEVGKTITVTFELR